jgi:hypothetical protein
MTQRSRVGSAVRTISVAVVGASVAAVALRWLDRNRAPSPAETSSSASAGADAVIVEEKLRAYRDIMREIVALNREAVALDPDRFRHEADAIAFEQESALEEPYLDVHETYESYLYVIGDSVREATSDYVDYLATYHDEGSHAGALLYRAGEVYEAMRADLGLESLFDEDSAEPPNVDTEGGIMPEYDEDDPPEIDDFTETLGSVEDLEYFNAGTRNRDGEDEEADSTDGDEDDPNATDGDEDDPNATDGDGDGSHT